MVEEPSEEQVEEAQETEETCAAGQAQAAKIAAEEAMKKAADAAAEVAKNAAQIPLDAIKTLTDICDKLTEIIQGVKVPDINFDPMATIEPIKTAIVDTAMAPINTAMGVGVPEVPGLSQIGDLFSAFGSLASDESGSQAVSDNGIDIDSLVPSLPDIPPEIKLSLIKIQLALQSMFSKVQMMGMKLVSLAFEEFKSLPVVGTAMAAIKPLDAMIDFTADVPDIMADASAQISNAIEGLVKQKLREIQALKTPSPPSDLEAPSYSPTCPQHSGGTSEDDESSNEDEDESEE